MDYEKQANDFLQKTNTKFVVKFVDHDRYFSDDKEMRDIYQIVLMRDGKNPYIFRFGQSIAKSGAFIEKRRHPPTPYDVLSCITKHDPGSFENFCFDFGYDTDSRKAMDLYRSVKREWHEINRLFGGVIEELQEIN